MNFRKYFLFVAILFFWFLSNAQEFHIGGVVVDKNTQEPIPFATVAFYETGNPVPIDGTTTDLNGSFDLNVVFQGSHYLGFSFIGYENYELPVELVSGSNEFDIGQIGLTSLVLELEEVEVSAMARTAVNRLDRISYRAEDFETARGGTASDLLSRLPGLSVSPEGEVSVRGTTDFVVYLNGRPTQIEPDVLLAQLSANSIVSIDIITVPSAAYDAQGKGGIINITTKREGNRGTSVSVNTRLGGSPWGNTSDKLTGDHLDDNRYGGGFNLIYSTDDWMAYGGFNYDYRNLHGSRTGTARIIDPVTGLHKIMDADGLKPEWHENISANFGYERNFSSSSIFSFSYYFGSRLEGRIANYLYNNFFSETYQTGIAPNKINENFTFNPNKGIRKGLFNTINADYAFSTNNDSKWLISGLFEYSNLSHDIDNPNIHYNPTAGSLGNVVSHYMQFDETPLFGYRFSAEYQKQLPGGIFFSAGFQPQYVVISGDFHYDTLHVGSNRWGAYRSLENSSELRRGIYAGYVDGTGHWDRLQLNAGLRVEHTDQALSIDNPDYFNLFERPVQPQYLVKKTDLFPSLHALYRLTDTDNLGFAASRRISRSPVKNMFPFLYRRHLEVYVVGDPALKPEYIQNVELSYQKSISAQQFNLIGFYRGVTNAVFRVNTVFPDELVLMRSFTNAGETSSIGAELNTNLEWGNRAKFFFGASLYHFQVRADIFGYIENNQSTNWNIKGSGNILLGRQFRLSADFDVRSAEVTAQGRNELFFMTNAALSYNPVKYKGWSANLRVLNLLNTNNRVLSTRAYSKEGVQIFYQDTDFYYYGPIAELQITFSISQSRRSQARVRSGFGRDEF